MKAEGIVISVIDYKEASKIVNLYTKNGKIGIKALGSKKIKNGLLGFITTGNIVSFLSSDSEFPNLLEYDIISSLMNKNLSFDDLKVVGQILYIINNIPEDSPHNLVYEFLKKVFLNIGNIDSNKLLSIFLIKMLFVFGVTPNLKSCIRCNNKLNLISFDIKEGGALCNLCSNLESDNLKIWTEYYYDKKEFNEFSDTDFNKLLDEIKYYYSYHLNIKIKI